MKKNKLKLLKENYDYYRSIKDKSDHISENIFEKNNEFLKAKLYNLVLNLCNQMVYDYIYVFTKDDLYFIADHNINIQDILDYFIIDIKKIKGMKV